MMLHEDNDIFLSQLISGILLFKRRVCDKELVDIISLFYNILKLDVIDEDSDYDDIYRYIDQEGNGYCLKSCYNYDSLLIIKGKKIKLYDYLKKNTTAKIIEFLENNIYYECTKQEDNLGNNENTALKKKNSFLKEKLFVKKKI